MFSSFSKIILRCFALVLQFNVRFYFSLGVLRVTFPRVTCKIEKDTPNLWQIFIRAQNIKKDERVEETWQPFLLFSKHYIYSLV